jgi:hypothetical protein
LHVQGTGGTRGTASLLPRLGHEITVDKCGMPNQKGGGPYCGGWYTGIAESEEMGANRKWAEDLACAGKLRESSTTPHWYWLSHIREWAPHRHNNSAHSAVGSGPHTDTTTASQRSGEWAPYGHNNGVTALALPSDKVGMQYLGQSVLGTGMRATVVTSNLPAPRHRHGSRDHHYYP